MGKTIGDHRKRRNRGEKSIWHSDGDRRGALVSPLLPLEYGKSVVDVFSDGSGKQLSPDCVFLHFLVIAGLGNQFHTRFQIQIG